MVTSPSKQQRAILEDLAKWLNSRDPALAQHQAEVSNAVRLLRKKTLQREERRALMEKFYRAFHLMWTITHGGVVEMFEGGHLVAIGEVVYDPDPSLGTIINSEAMWRNEADTGLLLLSRLGTSHSPEPLGQCERCKRYFVAKRKTKRYCSEVCQQEAWNDYYKTSTGKKKLAQRVARWRARQRELRKQERKRR